ncbi:hypothetical protein [Arthrobacter sp. UYCo732]|uniref:hypothetical protein n=1 Tax=Arthrobacter sp. UYCo732 TaxID=3156336 RepID=UPI003394926E
MAFVAGFSLFASWLAGIGADRLHAPAGRDLGGSLSVLRAVDGGGQPPPSVF